MKSLLQKANELSARQLARASGGSAPLHPQNQVGPGNGNWPYIPGSTTVTTTDQYGNTTTTYDS